MCNVDLCGVMHQLLRPIQLKLRINVRLFKVIPLLNLNQSVFVLSSPAGCPKVVMSSVELVSKAVTVLWSSRKLHNWVYSVSAGALKSSFDVIKKILLTTQIIFEIFFWITQSSFRRVSSSIANSTSLQRHSKLGFWSSSVDLLAKDSWTRLWTLGLF